MTALIPDERRVLEGCELRATDKGGTRRFEGRVVRWDQWDLIGGLFYESYQRNCFKRSIQERATAIPLLVGHKHDALPIGRATEWSDRDDALYGVWDVSDTTEARDAWTLIRDGALTGLSVGFSTLPKQDAWFDAEPPDFPRVVRRNCVLREVSAVSVPALEGSEIVAVRTAYGKPTGTPHLDAWRRWAADLRG